MDYVKSLIKSPTLSSQQKFKALLLLKECMKTGVPAIVNHTDKKILSRLGELANSKLGPDCLKEFNKAAEPVWSGNFHQLNRECIQNWSQLFKHTNPNYGKEAQRLLANKRIPIDDKYWDFPDSLIRQRQTEQANQIENRISDLRTRRNYITRFLGTEEFGSTGDANFKFLVDDYIADSKALKTDEVFRAVQAKPAEQQTAQEKQLIQSAAQEINFHEQFNEAYEGAKRDANPKEFMINYQNIHQAFFESEPVNLQAKINQWNAPPPKPAVVVPQPEYHQDFFDDYDQRGQEHTAWGGQPDMVGAVNPQPSIPAINNDMHFQATDPKNNSIGSIQNDYPGLINNPPQPLPQTNGHYAFEDEPIVQANEELIREIEELEGSKKKLEENLRRIKPQSNSMIGNRSGVSPSRRLNQSGIGLFKVMRNTDMQVLRMNQELKRVEGEFVRVARDDIVETKDYGSIKYFKTADGLELELPRRSVSRKVQAQNLPKSTYGRSKFVDQLHYDINRVLNKPMKYHQRPPAEIVF